MFHTLILTAGLSVMACSFELFSHCQLRGWNTIKTAVLANISHRHTHGLVSTAVTCTVTVTNYMLDIHNNCHLCSDLWHVCG